MAQRVAGEEYESITGQLFEIGRQLRQSNGYPFDPTKLKKHLQDAIEGRFVGVQVTAKVWKTWKKIQLGTGLQTADDFRNAVTSAGMKIGDQANYILGKPAFTVAGSVTEVELVVASIAKLGFKDGAICEDICVRVQELGLDLCPPEVGPQLRLQYADQPKGEWLVIAMKPIFGLGGVFSLFSVVRDGVGRWLDTDSGNHDDFLDGSLRLVFLRRKQVIGV